MSIQDSDPVQATAHVSGQAGVTARTGTEAAQLAAALALAALMDSLEHRLRVLGDTTALTRLRSAQSALTTSFNLNQETGADLRG